MNGFEHRFGFSQDLMISEPQHTIPARFQFSCSSIIGFFLFEMVSAVDLDDQFRIETHEVHDIPSDRQLAAKLVSGAAAVAQVAPEFSFGFGLVAAQRPCKRFQGSLRFFWSVRQGAWRVQYPLTLSLSRWEREPHADCGENACPTAKDTIQQQLTEAGTI